ncbi:MAG: PAS domain S-box protein [Actinomycetota bacterium]
MSQTSQETAQDLERFKQAFASAPVGMALVGSDFRFLETNDALCSMLGYPREELTGLTFLDITHPDDAEIDAHLAKQLFAGELPHYRIEKRYLTKSGDVLWVDLSATLISAEDGTPYGFGIIENITDRKTAEIQLRDLEAEQRRLLDATMGAVEDERSHLAGELSDGTIPRLTAFAQKVETVRATLISLAGSMESEVSLHEVQEGLTEEASYLYTLAGRLRPVMLAREGLEPAIEGLAEWLKWALSMPCTISVVLDERLPPEVEINIYRIAQEAVTNIIRHSRATLTSISVWKQGDQILMHIRDNGVGFDPSSPTRAERMGIGLMRRRAQALGGTFSCESVAGGGTSVRASIPMPVPAVADEDE